MEVAGGDAFVPLAHLRFRVGTPSASLPRPAQDALLQQIVDKVHTHEGEGGGRFGGGGGRFGGRGQIWGEGGRLGGQGGRFGGRGGGGIIRTQEGYIEGYLCDLSSTSLISLLLYDVTYPSLPTPPPPPPPAL